MNSLRGRSELTCRLLWGGLEALAAFMICQSLLTRWGLPILAVVLFGLLQAALSEFTNLTARVGAKSYPLGVRVIVSSAFVCACQGFHLATWPCIAASAHIALYLGAIAFVIALIRHSQNALLEIAVFLCGILYLALPLSCLYQLVENCGADFPLRYWWAMYAVILTKATDIGAWATGKLVGRHPLGSISPHKTLEGVFGGLIAGFCAGLLLTQLRPSPLNWKVFFLFGALHLAVSCVAQVGDLVESLLKRQSGARHSGHLPGLGGVLDTLDSLLFTFPFLYLVRDIC